METVIYVDVLFLVNWMMDAVLLILTGRLLKRRVALGRISLASALGALWVCVCAALGLRGWAVRMLGIIGMGLVMVRIAYPARAARELIRALLCLGLVSVLAGGLIHIVYDGTVFGRFLRLWLGRREAGAVSVWLLAGAMIASFLAIECGARLRELDRCREFIQDVTLYCGERQLTVAALWDSGTQLCDPFTGQPVHILELGACKELIGCERWEAFQETAAGKEESLPVGARLIPCRSMGNPHGLIAVMAVDRMATASGERFDHPLIGFCRTELSADQNYRMLLHSQTDKKRRSLNGY